MQGLSRGWSFLQEAWQMAFKDKDLIKPSIYAIVVGLIVTVIGIVPLAGSVFVFGESGLVRARDHRPDRRSTNLHPLCGQLHLLRHDRIPHLRLSRGG